LALYLKIIGKRLKIGIVAKQLNDHAAEAFYYKRLHGPEICIHALINLAFQKAALNLTNFNAANKYHSRPHPRTKPT